MKLAVPYFKLLDGLRGLAILAVLYTHTSFATVMGDKLHLGNGGFIGVDIFFVLSSFLITTLLLKEYLNFGNISVKKFYARRLIRLSPALLLSLAIFIPLIFFFISWKAGIKDSIYTLTYTANLVSSLKNFLPEAVQPHYFAHTWSLAAEEQFYLVFPFALLFVLNKKVKLFQNNYAFALLVTGIFLTAIAFFPILKAGTYSFPLWRIAEFLLGFWAALIHANIVWRNLLIQKTAFLVMPKPFLKKIAPLIRSTRLSLIALLLLLALMVFAQPKSWMTLITVHPLASIIAAFLILQAVMMPNQVVQNLFGNKALVKIGIISYGLYLYHFPVWMVGNCLIFNRNVEVASLQAAVKTGGWGLFLAQDALLLGLTFALSYLSYQFVEKPIGKYKSKFTRTELADEPDFSPLTVNTSAV
jgi:peptidoglycan/LPS O-acetylase OafA/YrhL